MEMKNKTEIRIIPFGLRQEETLVQIAKTMNNLETIVEDVFRGINNSIQQRRTELNRLKVRSESLNEKVNALSDAGKNSAITLYADSQFPRQRQQGKNDDRFERRLILSFGKPPRPLTDVRIRTKLPVVRHQKFTNKLQFYHVKNSAVNRNSQQQQQPSLSSPLSSSSSSSSSSSTATTTTAAEYYDYCSSSSGNVIEEHQQRGLGNLPADLESVDNLLLFNTAENLYKEYVQTTADPLDVFSGNRAQMTLEEAHQQTTNTIAIAAAPYSIVHNYYIDRNNAATNDYFSCFYTPAYQEIPSIDVPQNLPDLPGIAGDLKFSAVLENPFFDSIVNVNNNNNNRTLMVDAAAGDKALNNGGDNARVGNNIIADNSCSVGLSSSDVSKTNNNDNNNIHNNDLVVRPIVVVIPKKDNKKSEINSPAAPVLVETNVLPSAPPIPPPPPPPPPPLPASLLSDISSGKPKTDGITTTGNTNSSSRNNNNNNNNKAVTKSNNNNNAASSSDVHSNLMDAIRKAGGKDRAKLRPVTSEKDLPAANLNKNTTTTTTTTTTAAVAGGPKSGSSKNEQFMEDLYAKLALRRKGISGPNKSHAESSVSGGHSLLNKMSAIIPPASSDDSEQEDGNNTEWDDDD